MESIISRTLSVHQEHQILLALEKAGLNSDQAQKVIASKDNDLAIKIVRFIDNGGFEPTTSQKRARKIMGANFFGVEEAIKYLGVNPTRQQTATLAEIPFSEEALTASKDTHILIAVFPLSTLEIRGKAPQNQRLFYDQSWYNKESFAKERGEVSWHLIRRTPVPNSTSKTWDEQQALLSKDEETPTARIMTYMIIGHFLATGVRLFENIYVRSSDVASDGYRVGVGGFDAGGLRVGSYWGDRRDDDLGVSSARKSN